MAEIVAEEWLKQSGKQYMVEAVAEEWLKTWLNSTVCITYGLRTAAELSSVSFSHTTCWVCRWCSRLTVLNTDNQCCDSNV